MATRIGTIKELFGDYLRPVQVITGESRLVMAQEFTIGLHKSHPPTYWYYRLVEHAVGGDWLTEERKKPADSRHEICDMFDRLSQHWQESRRGKSPDERGMFYAGRQRDLLALARFGYELFIVMNSTEGWQPRVAKLRDPKEFRSARHEISTAAYLKIAGFDIKFAPDDVTGEGPRPETYDINATHAALGITMAVEAKRRHYELAQNPENRHPDGTWKFNIRQLLRKAVSQLGESPSPRFVCLDLGLAEPMPEHMDPSFMGSVTGPLANAAKQPDIVGGIDILAMMQLPYLRDEAFETATDPQVIYVVTEEYLRSQQWQQQLGPALERGREQYRNTPNQWPHFGPLAG